MAHGCQPTALTQRCPIAEDHLEDHHAGYDIHRSGSWLSRLDSAVSDVVHVIMSMATWTRGCPVPFFTPPSRHPAMDWIASATKSANTRDRRTYLSQSHLVVPVVFVFPPSAPRELQRTHSLLWHLGTADVLTNVHKD
jgi:hypothetical protein